MSLLDVYNRMATEAAELEKAAAEVPVNDERMEVIEKYASWAHDALVAEVGEGKFTAEDVEKVALAQMEADAEELANREKVAEFYELGQIMYQGFKDAAAADVGN